MVFAKMLFIPILGCIPSRNCTLSRSDNLALLHQTGIDIVLKVIAHNVDIVIIREEVLRTVLKHTIFVHYCYTGEIVTRFPPPRILKWTLSVKEVFLNSSLYQLTSGKT